MDQEARKNAGIYNSQQRMRERDAGELIRAYSNGLRLLTICKAYRVYVGNSYFPRRPIFREISEASSGATRETTSRIRSRVVGDRTSQERGLSSALAFEVWGAGAASVRGVGNGVPEVWPEPF